MIATSRHVSDDCGDVQRWSKMGISFRSRVEESKGHAKLAKRSRRLQRDIEGRADIDAVYWCGKCENMCSETAVSHQRGGKQRDAGLREGKSGNSGRCADD
jgi:ferredoxin